MVENNIDKRIIKTKNNIRVALIELLIEKDISKITITELTNKCLINRATFYLHYNSIYDVLDDIENELIKGVMDMFSQFDIVDLKTNPYPLLKVFSDQLKNFQSLSKFLMSSTSGAQLLNKLKVVFKKNLFDEYLKKNLPNDNQIISKIDRACTFVMAGTIDIYQEWYNNTINNISLENLCLEISTLITQGINSLDCIIKD